MVQKEKRSGAESAFTGRDVFYSRFPREGWEIREKEKRLDKELTCFYYRTAYQNAVPLCGTAI